MRYRDSYCHIVNVVFAPTQEFNIYNMTIPLKVTGDIRKENIRLDIVSL